jgi:hypothetical protein
LRTLVPSDGTSGFWLELFELRFFGWNFQSFDWNFRFFGWNFSNFDSSVGTFDLLPGTFDLLAGTFRTSLLHQELTVLRLELSIFWLEHLEVRLFRLELIIFRLEHSTSAMAATPSAATIELSHQSAGERLLRARQWPCCRHHQGPPPLHSAATIAVLPPPPGATVIVIGLRPHPGASGHSSGSVPTPPRRLGGTGGDDTLHKREMYEAGRRRLCLNPTHRSAGSRRRGRRQRSWLCRHFSMSSPTPSPPPLTTITVRNARDTHVPALQWDSSPSMTNRTQTTKTVTFASVSPSTSRLSTSSTFASACVYSFVVISQSRQRNALGSIA